VILGKSQTGGRENPTVRVAYLTGRYPGISHTFITREVRALRTLGLQVDTFSVWPTDRRLLLARADEEEHAATYTLLPPRPASTARAHLSAVLRRPRRYVRTIRRAVALRRPGLRGWGLALTWVLEAMVLWHECRRRGIRHVHVHLNGTAPTVALLLAVFADDSLTGGSAWTWSMTVHGPSEFYDTLGEQLAAKVRAAIFVICISDFARSQLMGLVEEAHWHKLHVVHCGVDPSVFKPATSQSSGETLRILNVGRLVPVKGHAVLIEALHLARERGVDAQLTIVGEGPARPELERLITRHDLSLHVKLAGAVGQDEIVDFYRSSEVFCISSFAEGVPVVLMEAMAHELPVVAPAIMGIPELIDDGVSGLLTRPARPDQIADSLAALAGSHALRSTLGRRARERVVADFAIDQCAGELYEVFCEYLTDGIRSALPTSSAASASWPMETRPSSGRDATPRRRRR
jgi:glycosyltransferase involved in cell wall biosynthesis